LRAIKSLGKSVPKDVAVVGFDDHPWMSLLDPPLTTVSQPMYDLGVTATQLLIDKIEGRVEGIERKVLPTTFVHRASCGC
jgi:LacI family transcriptional regulator